MKFICPKCKAENIVESVGPHCCALCGFSAQKSAGTAKKSSCCGICNESKCGGHVICG